jgi:prepilin-type N-terminal cleavage/methylation domain-containing protein
MNKKGVTLIELVVVFAIIGIGALLLAPGIGAWMPKYRLRSATRDIVATMRDAQMKAVTNRVQYQVNFNVAPNGYVLQRDSGGFVDYGARQTAPAGILINTANLPGGTAVFNPDFTCSAGNILLSYQKNGITQAQRGIRLSAATGRVRINE